MKNRSYHEESLFSRDDIQFPRLLAEIFAVGLSTKQIIALEKSMGLMGNDILDLFYRAENEWERIKGR